MPKVTPTTQVLTLEVQGGPHQGLSKTIDSTQTLRIGTEDCDLDLPACASSGIRAEHGMVSSVNGSWVYTSIDGDAFVNDKDIQEGESCSIGSDFILMLGDDIEIKVTIAKKASTSKKSGSEPTKMKITLPGEGKIGLKCEVYYPHCVVTKVTPGSAADKANILYSDTIVSIGGKTVGASKDMSNWEDIEYYIKNSRDGKKDVELVIIRAVSPQAVIDKLKSEVNANLEKVRTVFGAESIDYKKTTAQALIETNELNRMEKIPFLRNPDDEFVRLPYNPKTPYNHHHNLSFPEIKRKDRTKQFTVNAEDVKELELGLNSKFKPRHCYIKSCSSAMQAQGLKPGGMLRAVDMVRCPPSGGPKQEGNAKDMAEAVLRERTMDGRKIILSVEYPSYVNDCAMSCCPLVWLKECVANKPLQYSRFQNLDDCLCCCNCFCNTMEEDCDSCHGTRNCLCKAWIGNLIPKCSLCPCTCALMICSGITIWH
jgi:hypothetical protein